jgi:CRP/FNR family transcriptional regulator, cyclic AMP receptor protein
MAAGVIDTVMTWVQSETGKTVGYVALTALAWSEATAIVCSAYFKRMIPLRAAAMIANVLGIMLGLFTGNLSTLTKHSINLPLNFSRLREMRRLIASVKEASASNDLNMEWLKPFMHPESERATDYLFRKGDVADRAYLLIEGKVEIVEHGATLETGAIFGEMALFTRAGKRTASAKCLTDVSLLSITYEQFEQLYFQNPEFGLYLVRMIVRRFETNHKEAELESS